MRDTVRLSLCCNSPRNGVFRGRVPQLSIETAGHDLALESPYFDSALHLEIEERRFMLGRRREWMPLIARATWFGNWCWDALTVRPEIAASVVNFAVSKGYKPVVGPSKLFDLIESAGVVQAADLVSD